MIIEKIAALLSGRFRSAGPQQKRSILVIDDGPVERKFYVRVLQAEGYQVMAAGDGTAGLAAARNGKFDLILLDYVMPDYNGIEVCSFLKQDPQTKNIPIIFLTGSIRPENIINCYEVGAEHYLAKPISHKALVEQVRQVLNIEKDGAA